MVRMSHRKHLKLHENLRTLLRERSLTINSVSKKTNINKSTLHNYLNGVNPQGLDVVLKLAQFFEIPLNELLFGKGFSDITSIKVHEGHYEIIIKKME